jgi:hypothetical protein
VRTTGCTGQSKGETDLDPSVRSATHDHVAKREETENLGGGTFDRLNQFQSFQIVNLNTWVVGTLHTEARMLAYQQVEAQVIAPIFAETQH